MSNTLKVVDRVLKESLRVAHEKLQFIGTTDLQYDKSFSYQANRGPNGQTLRIREPNQYTRTQGSRVIDVQDTTESTQTITVATQDHVAIKFNSAELIQSVNSEAAFDDLSKNYIEPAISGFVSGIEADYIAYCTKATYNVAGTAGTALTDLVAVGAARAKINQRLAPKDNRYIQADSVTMGGMVNGIKGLFHDGEQIKRQYREGMMGRTAGADWYENDRMWTLTNGSDVTADTDAAALVTDGGNTIDMHTLLPVANQVLGSVFTIAGVYGVHPETKTPIGLQQFTITAVGATTTTVSPSFILSGAKRNLGDSTGAAIATTAFDAKTLTFIGAASTSYVQNLMYHKEAFQFITADLPLMDDAHKTMRATKDGLSLRVWMQSDIRNDELIMRIDMLYGMAALRPAWACRLIGSAS